MVLPTRLSVPLANIGQSPKVPHLLGAPGVGAHLATARARPPWLNVVHQPRRRRRRHRTLTSSTNLQRGLWRIPWLQGRSSLGPEASRWRSHRAPLQHRFRTPNLMARNRLGSLVRGDRRCEKNQYLTPLPLQLRPPRRRGRRIGQKNEMRDRIHPNGLKERCPCCILATRCR